MPANLECVRIGGLVGYQEILKKSVENDYQDWLIS